MIRRFQCCYGLIILLSGLMMVSCESGPEDQFTQQELARMEIEANLNQGVNKEEARRRQIEADIRVAEAATTDSLRIFERVNEDGSFAHLAVGQYAVRSSTDLIRLLETDFKHSTKHGLLVVLTDKRMVTETTNLIEELAEYCRMKGIDLWLRASMSRDANPYRQLIQG